MEQVFKGVHRGKMTVRNQSLLIQGIIQGDLVIEGDSDVELKGVVSGHLRLHGGSLLLRGMVRQSVTNHGGRLTVTGLVQGELRTLAGETVVAEKALVGSVAEG